MVVATDVGRAVAFPTSPHHRWTQQADALLKRWSLHPEANFSWDCEGIDPHVQCPNEIMHQTDLGVYKFFVCFLLSYYIAHHFTVSSIYSYYY